MTTVSGSSISGAGVLFAAMMMFGSGTWASVLTGWTTVGSGGTVDEDSSSIVELIGPYVRLKTNCLLGIIGIRRGCSVANGTVAIRYNIVPTGSLNVIPPTNLPVYTFSARFLDTGPTQRVLLYLKEVNLQSGNENFLLTFDSDSFSESTSYQTQKGPRPCQFTMNFDENAYYVDARISNSNGSPSPGVEAIWIVRCATL